MRSFPALRAATLAATLILGAGPATAAANQNFVPICDVQCQINMLNAKVNTLQSQISRLPKPVYAYCKDPHTLATSDGQTWACDPYICQGTQCLKQCASVSDCAAPYVCDQGGVCIAPLGR